MRRTVLFVSVLGVAVVGGVAGASTDRFFQSRPHAEPPGNPAAADYAYAVPSSAADLARLKEKWDQLNDMCRGGGGSDPLTDKACDAREEAGGQLEKAGFCYDEHSEPDAWLPCR